MLAYLRDADPDRYARELGDLLSHEEIRPHLKDLAFSLLAEVAKPTDEEWEIRDSLIAPALKAIEDGAAQTAGLSTLACRRFFASPPWFAATVRRGEIERWLAADNDRLVDMAVAYMWRHQKHASDSVATLLEPYADRDGEWTKRLRSLTEWADYHTSRPFFDLFLRLVDNGTLDEAQAPLITNGTFWRVVGRLSEERPEWFSEFLAHWLRHHISIVRATGGKVCWEKLFDHDESAIEPIKNPPKALPPPSWPMFFPWYSTFRTPLCMTVRRRYATSCEESAPMIGAVKARVSRVSPERWRQSHAKVQRTICMTKLPNSGDVRRIPRTTFC